MAHTVSRQIYDEEKKKYLQCEILILDQDEGLPPTDEREIVLYCNEIDSTFSEIGESSAADIDDSFPETELIDEYTDYDDYKDDKFGEEGKKKYFQ